MYDQNRNIGMILSRHGYKNKMIHRRSFGIVNDNYGRNNHDDITYEVKLDTPAFDGTFISDIDPSLVA